MSGSGMRRTSGQKPYANTSAEADYSKTLLEYAELLALSMGSKLPAAGLQIGVLHQLEGKKLHGANCTSIIIFPGSHAVFVDYSTGAHVNVDTAGRRTTAMLRPTR